jgi:predicted DNA repair protein MutK
MQAFVVAVVGIGITVAVDGVVALIVKADDVGVALARNDGGSTTRGLCRAIGRALVLGMHRGLNRKNVKVHSMEQRKRIIGAS